MAAQLSRQQSDLKNRVITCLNKLSDRDTLPQATNELESIAKTLSNDGFAPFLTCLSTTDSSEKSPVRRQCVRILGVLSVTYGDALSPHLSKMLTSLLRRLRDPDTSVRSACVDAVSSIASHITRPPFSLISKPLIDCISHEQDFNAQIGASLCLAAAIVAAPEPDLAELRNLLPRLLKLVKNDCFKAKSALISLIGNIARVGAASSKNVVNILVSTMVEFLSSEDWSARKAAAEALGMLAVAERDVLSNFKSTCLAALQSRRFDKVKVVRETMNRAMELWKEVPGVSDEVSDEAESKSSVKDFGSDDIAYMTPFVKKAASRIRSPTSTTSSTTSNQKKTPLRSDFGKAKAARHCRVDPKRSSECKTEVAVSQNSVSKAEDMSQNLAASDSEDGQSCLNRNLESKCFPFNRNSGERRRFGGLKSEARVVPLYSNADCDSTAVDNNATDLAGSQKEFKNLYRIQKQLRQIENQQSSLLDLLQSFIGHSQNGMNSLERRVNGLEKALDVMCSDLALSTGRITDNDATGNTCCMLPGAEFLSPKFWRKSEGQNFSSKVSSSNRCQPLNFMPNKYVNPETSKLEEKHQIGSLSSVDIMGDDQAGSREISDSYSKRRINRLLKDADAVKGCYSGGLDKALHATCVQQQTLNSWTSGAAERGIVSTAFTF